MGLIRRLPLRLWNEITPVWNRHRKTLEGRKIFTTILEAMGWSEVEAHSFKDCYGHPDYDVVIKFDYLPSHRRDLKKTVDARLDHTYTEWRMWKNASTRVRRYLVPIYFHCKGLIVQRRIIPCRWRNKCIEVSDRVVRLVNTSHWGHHTHIPRLMFFDYDNEGFDAYD